MGTPLGSGLRNALALGGSSARLQQYAREHGLSASDYPEKLVELYERNPETEQFVFEYPLMKDNPPSDDLSGLDTSSVPLLMQWDQRWGYGHYAGNLFGLSGCGPGRDLPDRGHIHDAPLDGRVCVFPRIRCGGQRFCLGALFGGRKRAGI